MGLGGRIEEYLEGRVARAEIGRSSKKDIASRLTVLVDLHGTRDIAELDRATVLEWQAAIGHLSPATRRAYLSSLRGFCAWAVEEGLLAADPCVGIRKVKEPRRVPRALPAEAVGRLLAVLPDDRARAIVWLELGCGLRCIEVANLDVDDYDAARETIIVRGKGDHERPLPVPAATAEALHAYLDVVGWTPGPLIRAKHRRVGDAGGRLTRMTISQLVIEWMTTAGVHRVARDGRTAHALRHTAASDVMDVCLDLRVVQQMLGHQSLATTEKYLRRVDQATMRQAMEGRRYFTAS